MDSNLNYRESQIGLYVLKGIPLQHNILLLTKSFPFDRGDTPAESYLETEIEYLADRFDRVLILALDVEGGRSMTVRLPKNVTAEAIGIASNKLDKLNIAIDGMRNKNIVNPNLLLGNSKDSNSVVYRLFAGYFSSKAYRKYQALIKYLQCNPFDFSSVYSFWFFDNALVACMIKNLYPGIRAVSRAHRYDLYEECNKIGFLPGREYLLKHLDAVVPCSLDGENYLKIRYPRYSSKIKVGYLGTRELPDRSNESGDGLLRIVSCSSVCGVKRVQLIVDALKILDEEGLPFHWTHFGDGPLSSALRRRAADLSPEKVSLPGFISNSELLKCYSTQHFDLFLNVSRSEGLPISIMEACGTGLPVLATNVGGVSEIVKPGKNGVLLDPNIGARELANSIKDFYHIPERSIACMRSAARIEWENHFRASANVAEFSNICLPR